MGRLTLRLPETLHQQLEALARNEEVSLNHYIVYALTRQATLAYTVSPVPEGHAEGQKAAYTALLQGLGTATFGEVEKALSGREKAKAEKGLTSQVVRSLQGRIARQRVSTGG